MITVTQFHAIVLKTAKQHLAKIKKSTPAAEAAPTAPEAAVEAVPAAPVEAPTEAAASAPVEGAPAAETGPSLEVTTLMQAMNLDEKRAARLVDALNVVGNRLDRVRQVTVVQPTGAPARATVVGEFAYVVDALESGGGDRRDRRGGGHGGRPGGGRPGGNRGAPKGPKGAKPGEVEDLTGPFSMEAAAADRKRAEMAERAHGGPGGGRGAPRGRGGPRGPGGGRGGPRGQGGPRGPGGGGRPASPNQGGPSNPSA